MGRDRFETLAFDRVEFTHNLLPCAKKTRFCSCIQRGKKAPLGRNLNLWSGSRQIFLHRSDARDSWMNWFHEWVHSLADHIILSAQSYATMIVSSGFKADDLRSCLYVHFNPLLLPFPTGLTPAHNGIGLWILFHGRLAIGARGPEGLLSPHVFPKLDLIDANTWLGIIVIAGTVGACCTWNRWFVPCILGILTRVNVGLRWIRVLDLTQA